MKRFFQSRWGRSLIVLVVLALFVHFAESRGYLHGLQMTFGLDPMLQSSTAEKFADIAIIEITDTEYKDQFCGQSPLDGRGVLALVNAVREKLHPAVIGVDLDTSDWEPGKIPASCSSSPTVCTNAAGKIDQSCLASEINKVVFNNRPRTLDRRAEEAAKLVAHPESGSAPPMLVVWAQVSGEPIPAAERKQWWAPVARAWRIFWKGDREPDMVLPLRPVAGRTVLVDSILSGVPRFPLDPDGVVRGYQRRYRVAGHDGSSSEAAEMSSLPHALLEACESCVKGNRAWWKEERAHSEEDLILKFVPVREAFRLIDARYILPVAKGKGLEAQQPDIDAALALQPRPIALIGGTYKGARDVYRTPLGEMAGVELMAQAVETELHEGIEEASDVWKLLVDMLAGVLVIVLWKIREPAGMSVRTFFLASLATLAITFGAFSRFLFRHGIWLDAVAIVVGVFIHQVWEEFEEVEKREEKIEEYEKQIEEHTNRIAQLERKVEETNAPGVEKS